MTSFVQKAIEKMLDSHLRDSTLVDAQLHTQQFANQEGKSTIGALQSFVKRTKSFIADKKFISISFSIDIEGAFIDLNFAAIVQELIKRNTDGGRKC